MAKKHLHTDLSLTALLSTLLVTAFAIVIPQLHALNEVAFGYYHSLPVSELNGDFDKDGIPNHIDDSDGDTISDKYDATPFGVLHAAAKEEEGEEGEDTEE
jgi:hypothetical protein